MLAAENIGHDQFGLTAAGDNRRVVDHERASGDIRARAQNAVDVELDYGCGLGLPAQCRRRVGDHRWRQRKIAADLEAAKAHRRTSGADHNGIAQARADAVAWRIDGPGGFKAREARAIIRLAEP